MANGGATLRTRRDAWKLPAGDQTLTWYAKAVAQLKTLPISDPTSWRYQAAIHDYIPGKDPLSTPHDHLPTGRGRFWKQCQHGCAFFLPWHRIYLHYFEAIIAKTVVQLGGPANWSLPYWNYSDAANPNARKLPPAFRAPTLADGSPNALLVPQRVSGANAGQDIGDELDVDLSCLTADAPFYGAGDGTGGGFGGKQTNNPVHSGDQMGGLEATPHGSMHVAVGGTAPPGWMSSFNTAPLDPIFWLHHANIDRLWEVWLRRDPKHLDPTDAGWKTQVFWFHDANGRPVSNKPADVLDTTSAFLDYQYEDVSDPFAGA